MRFKPVYKQLTTDGFRSSLEGLDKKNRWVWLGDHFPWEEYEKLYGQKLNNQTARVGEKPARMVIGAMLAKQLTRLSDVDTMCFFAKNVMKFFREPCHSLIGLLRFFVLLPIWRPEIRPALMRTAN